MDDDLLGGRHVGRDQDARVHLQLVDQAGQIQMQAQVELKLQDIANHFQPKPLCLNVKKRQQCDFNTIPRKGVKMQFERNRGENKNIARGATDPHD